MCNPVPYKSFGHKPLMLKLGERITTHYLGLEYFG